MNEKLQQAKDAYFAQWRQGASDEGCVNAESQFVSLYDCKRIADHFYNRALADVRGEIEKWNCPEHSSLIEHYLDFIDNPTK